MAGTYSQQGKRLEAVKAYRDATGAGMDQALEVIAGL
jgi:ribosomal protein L7/L12